MLCWDEGNFNTRGKPLKKGRLRFYEFANFANSLIFREELGDITGRNLMMAGVFEAELVDPK